MNNQNTFACLNLFCLCLTVPTLSILPQSAYASELDDQTLAETYAPLVRLHPDEQFFPDSVENYLFNADPYGEHMNSLSDDAKLLDSEKDLGSSPYSNPSTLPNYLQGNESGITSGDVPIYSYIKEVTSNVTDILYVMYYPYNEGKKICDAMELDIVDVGVSVDTSLTPKLNITIPTLVFKSDLLCAGSRQSLVNESFASIVFTLAGVPQDIINTTFGNHPTDAEYYMVRLENDQPIKILTGAHGEYLIHDWHDVTKEGGTHAIIYAGRGGHGTFIKPGKQNTLAKSEGFNKSISASISQWGIGLKASASVDAAARIYSIDDASDNGLKWQTWKNVETFKWESKNNVEGYPQYPWVSEYNDVFWGSQEFGKAPSISFGVDLSVGISKKVCLKWIGCKTLSLRKSDNLNKTITLADEKELSGANGSVKIGRADKMFEEFYEQLRPNH